MSIHPLSVYQQSLNTCQTVKNDHILDFQVSMELSHRDASVGWGWGRGKTGKAAAKRPKMI